MLVSYSKSPNKLEWSVMEAADKLDKVKEDWFELVDTSDLNFSENRRGSFVQQLSVSLDLQNYLKKIEEREGNLFGKKLVVNPNTTNKMLLNESLVKYWTQQVLIREKLSEKKEHVLEQIFEDKPEQYDKEHYEFGIDKAIS